MVSKNNKIKKMEETAERQSHFGIRKLTIGATSVLLGTTLWLGTNVNSANAAVNGNDSQNAASTDSNKNVQPITSDTKIEVAQASIALDTQTNNNDSLQKQLTQESNSAIETNQIKQSNGQEGAKDQPANITSNVNQTALSDDQSHSSQTIEREEQNSGQQNTSVESNTTVAQFQGLKTRSASLSAAQLSSLLNTSLVATSKESATDLDSYNPNFNISNGKVMRATLDNMSHPIK